MPCNVVATPTTAVTLGVLRENAGRWLILRPESPNDPGVFRVRHASEGTMLRRGMYVRCAGGGLPLDQAASRKPRDGRSTLVGPEDLEVRCSGVWLAYEEYLQARRLVERMRRRPEVIRLLQRAA